MGKCYTYGYKDSHSQTKIPKYSPTWQAWRAGNIKPKPYFDFCWCWELTIEYFNLIEELESGDVSIYRQLFAYKHRQYAVNTRDLMETNLMLDGKTIKSVRIRLVRL